MNVKLVTNFGEIELELDMENTPLTAENFLSYVREGYYSGTLFHRVIDGFMIQGGGFEPGMVHKEGNDAITNEANQGASNSTGTVAMARTSDPHSASSQFFINTQDNTFLDHTAETIEGWGYCVFAKVVAGMDVVNAISKVETGSAAGHGDVPVEDVIIEFAEIVDGGSDATQDDDTITEE